MAYGQFRPQKTQILLFLYGYLPESVQLDALLAKYRPEPAKALKQSSAEWKRHGMRFNVGAEPWVKRETIWNHYYLRSSLTYDDFFGEHILNQNGIYQYAMGFQGAARDPLQHCLPFLFSDPEIVKSDSALHAERGSPGWVHSVRHRGPRRGGAHGHR